MIEMATEKQVDYITILFQDLCYDLKTKKAFLKREYNVDYADELNKYQASVLIKALLEIKNED